MDNKVESYFEISGDDEKNWHRNVIGEYHVSSIGLSHADLEPEEHYGPCLRATYFNYKNNNDMDLNNKGNVTMGKILHEHVQRIYKERHPNSIIEFPIFINYDEDIKILGSVDILVFGNGIDEDMVIDIKSASMYTFPSSKYDYNATYISQIKIYAGYLIDEIFKDEYFNPQIGRIVYIKKHNLETIEMDFQLKDLDLIIDEFEDRVEKLHDCLINNVVPDAEPHKWCKYCPNLEYCLENEDVMEIKEGRKKRILKNE